MAVLISGSVAYDRIMDFPGRFSDHILPGKIHKLNVSFGLKRLAVRFGGTAGNIGYTLALFGIQPTIIAQVGSDAADYLAWLKKHHIDQRAIRQVRSEHTATAHIITDLANNQIAAFHFGAMDTAATADPHIQRLVKRLVKQQPCIGILAAGNLTDMVWLARLYQGAHIPYIVDPGQQLVWLTAAQLRTILRGAHTLIVNDYEWALVQKKLATTAARLRASINRIIVTLGEHGATWYHQATTVHQPIARPQRVVDPTGAGDAYRAGVILGMLQQWPDELSGRVAALCATYAIEQYGTQVHHFSPAQFRQRFQKIFKFSLPL